MSRVLLLNVIPVVTPLFEKKKKVYRITEVKSLGRPSCIIGNICPSDFTLVIRAKKLYVNISAH